MEDKKTDITGKTKEDFPNYICGYKIEREFGDKDIKDCIRDIVSARTTE